jgi:hypothetical protein
MVYKAYPIQNRQPLISTMKILFFTSLLIACTTTLAQAQLAQIPFLFKGENIHIKLQIASSDTLDYMFDSGATCTTLDSATAVKINIDRTKADTIGLAGLGGIQKAIMIHNQTITLGKNLKVEGISPILINYTSWAKLTGVPLAGIVGYDIMNRYITQLDFDTKKMSFYADIKEVDTAGYTALPFTFINGPIPHITASITLSNGETFSGKVMFDLGAGSSLIVTAEFNNFHHLSEKARQTDSVKAAEISSAAAKNRVDLTKIKSMQIAGFTTGSMPVSLMVNPNATPQDGYLGIAGIDVLKRFNMIIDYADKKIYLKPNRSFNQ